ncbi:MAG: Spy/CpxP family protein refolding chaperone [Acidobacteria bacterium]|nr:Spy/CpxP family protein refolding chaperone [Acidobacteriota bacterium]
MNSYFTKFLVLSAVSIGLAFGQQAGSGRRGMGGPMNFDPAAMLQRRIEMLATRLELTDAQKAQATKIFTDEQTAAQPLQTSVQQNRQSLRDAVKKNDLGAIDQLSAAIGNLEGQLLSMQSKAGAAFYAILTADQQAKAGAGGPGGGRGPGGMGGGPMGRQGWGRQ